MIAGCGIDTEEIKRFDKHLSDIQNSGFVKLVYTSREIKNYGQNYRRYIPLSFCCKEAFFKAIGDSWTTSSVHWQDIELIFDSSFEKGYEVFIGGHTKKVLEKYNNLKILSEYNISSECVTFHVILVNE